MRLDATGAIRQGSQVSCAKVGHILVELRSLCARWCLKLKYCGLVFCLSLPRSTFPRGTSRNLQTEHDTHRRRANPPPPPPAGTGPSYNSIWRKRVVCVRPTHPPPPPLPTPPSPPPPPDPQNPKKKKKKKPPQLPPPPKKTQDPPPRKIEKKKKNTCGVSTSAAGTSTLGHVDQIGPKQPRDSSGRLDGVLVVRNGATRSADPWWR